MRASTSIATAIRAQHSKAIVTGSLKDRPARTPDLATEIAFLHHLADALARADAAVLDILSAAAMQLCCADSAGVSLIEKMADGTELFRWVTTAGHCSPVINGTTPIDDSPCGVTLALGASQLFSYPQRHFECLRGPEPEVVEGLVVPIPGPSGPVGTLWVLSHTEGTVFDAEHLRVMTSLAGFTGAAVQVENARVASASRVAEAEQAARALQTAEARADDFISMLSHELRNPLAPIDAAIQTAQRLPVNNLGIQAALTVAERQMTRLSKLVSDLLDTTASATAKFPPRWLMPYCRISSTMQ